MQRREPAQCEDRSSDRVCVELRPIDFVLGEGSAAQRAALLRRCKTDLELAAEIADMDELVRRFRRLCAP